MEKLAVADPETFVDYYAFEALELASTAWLGPAYQVTSQLNVVNPGGVSQSPHRDYHLGFMTDAQAERYPTHVHALSPMLTLQGAVAHVDMPIESGPTMLLPHSHKYGPGYLAWRRPEVIDLFAERQVQTELRAGDAVFFNPAVLHGAGTNHTAGEHGIKRMGNLLQISSAMGIALEAVDRDRMCRAVLPALQTRHADGWSAAALDRVITATAFGYPFPTNLDLDPPIDGLRRRARPTCSRGRAERFARHRVRRSARRLRSTAPNPLAGTGLRLLDVEFGERLRHRIEMLVDARLDLRQTGVERRVFGHRLERVVARTSTVVASAGDDQIPAYIPALTARRWRPRTGADSGSQERRGHRRGSAS